MREIKFRALDLENCEIDEVESIIWKDGKVDAIIMKNLTREIIEDESYDPPYQITKESTYFEDNFILMQFTGLKDSTKFSDLTAEEQKEWLKHHKESEWNGKDIYEGDIVRDVTDGQEYIQQIIFDEEECHMVPQLINNVSECDNICMSDIKDDKEAYEIIGNIHENPELLIGEENE